MKKVWICLIGLVLLLTACSSDVVEPPTQDDQADKLKVALLLTSPAADGGWNATAYMGLQQVGEEMDAEIAVSENVALSDNEAVFRDYASRDFDLIVGHSFGFGDAAVAVAPDFPDTKFLITTGIVSAENVASYNPLWDYYFLSGALAGLMTQTDNVGILGGVEIPSMVAAANAIADGIRLTNPEAKISIAYVGDWSDPATGKELALAQIAGGADIITGSVSGSFPGLIEAIEEVKEKDGKLVYIFGDVVFDPSLAPEHYLAAHVQLFDRMVVQYAEQVAEGNFVGELYRPGLEAGLTDVVMSDLVPTDIQEQVEQIKQDIIDGKIVVEERYE